MYQVYYYYSTLFVHGNRIKYNNNVPFLFQLKEKVRNCQASISQTRTSDEELEEDPNIVQPSPESGDNKVTVTESVSQSQTGVARPKQHMSIKPSPRSKGIDME